MKKIFLSITLIISGLAAGFAQCAPDSTALAGQIITPYPETTDHPELGIHPAACVGKPFDFKFTFSIPETFNSPLGPVPLNFVKINTTGAIQGIPNWMTYECFPSDCKFLKNTLGSVCLKGTPPVNAFIGDTILQIVATANVVFVGNTLDYPVTLPKDFAATIPGNYILRTRPAGNPLCTVATDDLASSIYSISASPNPFSASTTLKIDALENENLQFRVVNMLGQTVENRPIFVVKGENDVIFHANNLPEGIYQYVFSNGKGMRGGKLVISK
jgi:hypothetical protein